MFSVHQEPLCSLIIRGTYIRRFICTIAVQNFCVRTLRECPLRVSSHLNMYTLSMCSLTNVLHVYPIKSVLALYTWVLLTPPTPPPAYGSVSKALEITFGLWHLCVVG